MGFDDNSDKSKLPAHDGSYEQPGWFQCNATFDQTWCIHPDTSSLVLSNVSRSCKHLDYTQEYYNAAPENKSWTVYVTKHDQRVCLHPDNRCNMVPHPLCKEGEDERQCKSEYVRKRKILEYAHFECESPHHNSKSGTASVKIYTTACDGYRECFEGIDEKNCEKSMPNYVSFGKFFMTISFLKHSK